MNLFRIYTCINQEPKTYGLKIVGLFLAFVGFILVWLLTDLPFGLIAGVPSYVFGSWLSTQIYQGKLHKIYYKFLPNKIFFKNKYLAKSNYRNFI